MDRGVSLKLRELIDKHSVAMLDELAGHVDSQLQAARAQAAAEVAAEAAAQADDAAVQAAEALEQQRLQAASEVRLARETSARETRLSTAESLNRALRRIRQAAGEDEALAILLESSAPFAQRAVVLRVESGHAESLAVRGIEKQQFSFPIESAAAIAGVCETRDPIVALGSAAELSPEIAAAFASPEGSGQGDPALKAYLFPAVARHQVVAVLIAVGDTVSAALELLAEAAGMKIEALEQPAVEQLAVPVEPLKPLPGPGLVQIAPSSVPQAEGSDPRSWSDLSPEDQKLHLQAQRVARVKVAEMRLYHADDLRKGVAEANIYVALGNEIDRARADFLQAFLSKSPTMVDYLHLEILRSLAHDDDRLLGQDYPGPMV